MNRHLKFRRTALLAGILIANLTFAAHATQNEPVSPFQASSTESGSTGEEQSSQTILAGSSRASEAAGPSGNSGTGSQTITVGQGQAAGPDQGSQSDTPNQSGQTARPDDGSGTPSASEDAPPADPTSGETSGQEADPELVPVTEEEARENAEGALPEGHPMAVPKREPRLQATVLPCDAAAWSQPFVNDQWCDVDGRPFYSISIFVEQIIGNIHYRAYTSTNGWTRWVMNGQQTPIPADHAPIEAIQLRFSGPVSNDYDLYYTTRLSDGRETGWARNGLSAGAMNQGLYMGGFRMAFFRKDDAPNITVDDSALVSAHADGIQYIDGSLRYIHGDGSNFTGWGWVGGQRYYFNDSYPVTGWHYIDGYKYYFDEEGKLVTDLEPIIGAQGPFLIRINKEMNCMTIFVQDEGNGYIIPLKSFLTSCGDDTPLGTFKTPEKYRWRLMIHDLYTQYATRLGSGLPILMHSIIYDAPNPFSVWASTYNHMGVARSAGCIRLTTADSKWIYDHCPLGTTVEVYNSQIPGPYERPTIAAEIPFEQTWDPTDPNITEEQKAQATASILAKFGY
ncbi:MAG: L,D-transpeptidase family protein [Lachnospiraceae bacterium]|jgi:hypothetical protein|nr:L,D-transpeptidase family protein [Lachnospiraceae bacterium]